MMHFIESHGIECILSYLVFAAIVGSMPPLPADANYWQRWGYGALQAVAMNLRAAATLLNLKLPTTTKEP